MPATHMMGIRAGIPVLSFPLLAGHPVDAVVTTRAGGVSEGPYATLNLGLHVDDEADRVVENRARAAATIGSALGDLVFANQVHGRMVALVSGADRGRGTLSTVDAVDGVDALVTREAGVGLAVLVADCAPILLYDRRTHAVAVVHAGWRGAVAGVAAAAVDALAAGGARREDLLAAVGPAVPADRYQVGEEVAEAASAAFGSNAGEVLWPDGTGRWRFDVWAANERVLAGAGVPAANLVTARVGTGGAGPFFSDRAARPCGRFALLAVLR
ncbi:MAG: polyphenol oxidase family protein [Actinomycetota bacterium]|nr:polyphenol oxidase family protein [Actinomycetota bacterium]